MDRNLSLVLHVSLIILTCFRACETTYSDSVPSSGAGIKGMFVFGDALMDNGNNNYIISIFKSNYQPYGLDFKSSRFPTGRFTNNMNLADHIGKLLRIPLLPTFMDPLTKGVNTSRGVNYASAGSGILDETSEISGIINLSKQISNFLEVTLPSLEAQEGHPSTNFLQQYIFLFSTGSNDYVTNFFPGGNKSVTLERFTANLTASLAKQITKLYAKGAKKFALLNVPPLGCSPVARATTPTNDCNETQNYAAFLFNRQLAVTLNVIKPRMPGFRFVVINFFQIMLEFITNPSSGGFTNVSDSCCELTVLTAGFLCTPLGSVCTNRNTHLYWDGLHPTDSLYGSVAARAYSSNNPSDVYPLNIQLLAQL